MSTQDRPWFRRRPRRRGYGKGWAWPATWEGWAAYAVHLTVVVVAAALAPPAISIAVLVLATVALGVVAARHGEPPAPPLPSDG